MNIDKLKAVLAAGHPGTGPYDADATVAADQGNLVNCTEDVETVTGPTLFEAVVPADYNALTPAQLTVFWGIVGMGTINVDGANVRATLSGMFSGTDTLTALVALQTRAVSHFQKEGLGLVYPGHIENARMP